MTKLHLIKEYKGMEISDIARTDKGKDALRKAIPTLQKGTADPKWGEKNKIQLNEVMEALNVDTSVSAIAESFGGQVVGNVVPRPSVPTDSQYLQKIITLLEKIETNTQKWVE